MAKWLEYPTLVREDPGLKPARVKLYSIYSMDNMIIPPMTYLTLKETEKSLMFGRKTTNKINTTNYQNFTPISNCLTLNIL